MPYIIKQFMKSLNSVEVVETMKSHCKPMQINGTQWNSMKQQQAINDTSIKTAKLHPWAKHVNTESQCTPIGTHMPLSWAQFRNKAWQPMEHIEHQCATNAF